MAPSGNGTGDLTVESIGELGEFALIERIRHALTTDDRILIGPGDDAAQVSVRNPHVLVSTDVLVDQRHFRRDWSTASEVGRKAAACNLSDLNAMGAVATALTVGLAAPADLPVGWVDEFVRGFVAECGRVGARLAGGDVTASDVLTLAVTAVGDAPRPVRRSGALPGDQLAVAGVLGLASAGYAALSRGFRSPRAAVEAHRVPRPPYEAGPQAAGLGATAMIDVSDGLLGDVGHIATASGMHIDIEPTLLPIPEAVATVGEALGRDPLSFVLTGGDDYALAATFSAETTLPPEWTRIGTVADTRGDRGGHVSVDGQDHEGEAGYEHWR